MRKKDSAPEILPEDQVKLKPVMALRPGVYLAVIYSCVIALILFLTLILPGLRKPGALVILETEPWGAALRADGVYLGTSPGKIFVPKGRHTLELVLPGFDSAVIECEIPGRVFASALFPRRYRLNVTLTCPDPAAALALSASDYAEWTFGGEPVASWQIPLSLSDGAYRTGGQWTNGEAAAEAGEILKAAARFAVTRAALRDLVRAKFLADSGGLPPSLSLAQSFAGIVSFLSENPESAAWLADTLPHEAAAKISDSGWYKKNLPAVSKETAFPAPQSAPRIRVSGLSFSGGTDGLMICDTAVSQAVYENFLKETPQWREEGTAAGQGGTAGVSWYAARAFCQWLTERLPYSMADYEARLPSADEWELAAPRSAAGDARSGYWEWCADPFAPLAFKASQRAVAAIGSPEMTICGWADGVGQETRASLPPDICSPFVTFRPVIAKKTRRHEP